MNNWWFTDAPFLGKSPLLLTLSMLTELCWLNCRFLHSWLISVQCCAPGSLKSGSWLRPEQNTEVSDWIWLGKGGMEEEGVIARFDKKLSFSLLLSFSVSLEVWKLFPKHHFQHAKILFPFSPPLNFSLLYIRELLKKASNQQWLQQLLSLRDKIKIHQNEMSWKALSCHSLVPQKIDLLSLAAAVQSWWKWLARFQYEWRWVMNRSHKSQR